MAPCFPSFWGSLCDGFHWWCEGEWSPWAATRFATCGLSIVCPTIPLTALQGGEEETTALLWLNISALDCELWMPRLPNHSNYKINDVWQESAFCCRLGQKCHNKTLTLIYYLLSLLYSFFFFISSSIHDIGTCQVVNWCLVFRSHSQLATHGQLVTTPWRSVH